MSDSSGLVRLNQSLNRLVDTECNSLKLCQEAITYMIFIDEDHPSEEELAHELRCSHFPTIRELVNQLEPATED